MQVLSLGGEISWRRKWQKMPVFLPVKKKKQPVYRGTGQAIVHGATKSRAQLNDLACIQPFLIKLLNASLVNFTTTINSGNQRPPRRIRRALQER